MQQKKIFTAGMDSDTSSEMMEMGRDRYRLNVRVLSSDNSTIGAIETVNGNSLVAFSLPDGNNTEIGSVEYFLGQKLYYFIYNSLGNHSILEFDSVANTIAKVFESDILNFSLDYLITGINVVELDSNNHLLYWTDNYNEPRKINIEKGKYFMQGDYVNGYKTPFNPKILYRIKEPLLYPPTYTWSPIELSQLIINSYGGTPVTDPVNQVYPIDSASVNIGGEFNTTTYEWTVASGSEGYYSIYYGCDVFDTSGSNSYIRLQINSIDEDVITAPPLASGYYNNTVNIFVNVGDVVRVVVDNGGAVSTQFVNCSMLVTRTSAQSVINYLFKKLFVFKVQYVYDDNEVSSWSPWSPYSYPEVVHDSSTGNDVIKQSSQILIDVPTGNSIATRIRIAAKELSNDSVSGDFFLIDDLNKAELNISDDSVYQIKFLNDASYLKLNVSESNKLFDSVPLLSQSQEIIDGGRIIDGLVTEGFDPVNIDMRLPLTYEDDVNNNYIGYKTHLKSGGKYLFGIQYYDGFNRSGTAQVSKGDSNFYLPDDLGQYGKFGTTLFVPFLTQDDYDAPHNPPPNNNDMNYVPKVNWEIYHAPPTWATHYQIVRTKNLAMDFYFQFVCQDVEYVDDLTGAVVPGNLATRMDIYIGNIIGRFKTENPTSTLVYDWVKGDRLRIIANRYPLGPTVITEITDFSDFNDTEIYNYDAANQIIRIKMTPSVPQNCGMGFLYEIYRPAKNVETDTELIYEVGECYNISEDIHGNMVHEGLDSNQLIVDFSSSTYLDPILTAQVSSGHGLLVGDKVKVVTTDYEVYGEVTVSNSTNVNISRSGFVINGSHSSINGTIYKSATGQSKSGDCYRIYQNMPWISSSVVYRMYMYVECSSASNLWVSNAYDYARPSVVNDSYKRITRPSTIIYSESFIPETFINGLSTVYDTSFESYTPGYGGIYKLRSVDQAVRMYQELKCSLITINQNTFAGTQGETIVGNSSQILNPTPRYYDGEFGIGKHPESFAFYGKIDYFIDVKRGAVLRLSNDGLTPISKTYFMDNYFTDKCRDVLAYNGKVRINGCWDTKFNEYLISFNPVTGVTGETVAFNEKFNSWSTFYSFVPEGFCTNGTGIVSFKNGLLYIHNTNNLQTNFYNQQYFPEIWLILNDNPSNVKIFQSLSEETDYPWEVIDITNPSGQSSNILLSDFQEKENNQYASLWKDINTPNVLNPLFEGDVMRDRTFLVKLKYNQAIYNKLNAVNFDYIISNLHNR